MASASPIECDLFGNEPAPKGLTFTVDQFETILF
jgi:hypothetical protein